MQGQWCGWRSEADQVTRHGRLGRGMVSWVQIEPFALGISLDIGHVDRTTPEDEVRFLTECPPPGALPEDLLYFMAFVLFGKAPQLDPRFVHFLAAAGKAVLSMKGRE